MKLFLDTSNKHLILALVNQRNEVYDFAITKSNNDMVEITVSEIDKFLNKNNITIDQVTEFMTTIGPGSFTGVKVGINFIGSIALTRETIKIHTIDSFKLIEQSNSLHTVIPFGKGKFYVKARNSKKIKVMNEKEVKQLPLASDGYSKMNKELLQKKINNKLFKIRDNLNKVEVKYLSEF